jgi:hypothetical protein
MAKKTYSELLRDPRWQRKRLEILQRSDFSCEECEATDQTLNVHHKLYRKGAQPWEYEAHELQALCEECHEAYHSISDILKSALAHMNAYEVEQVLGYVRGLQARKAIEPTDEAEEKSFDGMVFNIPSRDYAAGFYDALWIDYTYSFVEEFMPPTSYAAADLWELHVNDTVARVRRLKPKGLA